MKVVSILFSLYILVLSVAPCVDEGSHNLRGNNDQCSSRQDHRHAGTGTDSCLPFCVCSCCGSDVAVHHFMFDASPQLPRKGELVPVSSTGCSHFTPNFWQPPKLS